MKDQNLDACCMAQHVANYPWQAYYTNRSQLCIAYKYNHAPWNWCDVFGDIFCKLKVSWDYIYQ